MYAQRWRRAEKQLAIVKGNLAKHEQYKSKDGRINQEWIMRVILASPICSSRSLAQSFRDVMGVDSNTVSRFSIQRIKDAFVEMYKEMVLKICKGLISAHYAQSKYDSKEFASLFLLHVQDEADLRLRSGIRSHIWARIMGWFNCLAGPEPWR